MPEPEQVHEADPRPAAELPAEDKQLLDRCTRCMRLGRCCADLEYDTLDPIREAA